MPRRLSSNPSVFHEPWMLPQAPRPAAASGRDAGHDFADPDNPYAPPTAKASAFRSNEDAWEAFSPQAPDRPTSPLRRSWLGGFLAFWRSIAGFPEPEQLPSYRSPRESPSLE